MGNPTWLTLPVVRNEVELKLAGILMMGECQGIPGCELDWKVRKTHPEGSNGKQFLYCCHENCVDEFEFDLRAYSCYRSAILPALSYYGLGK